MANKDNGIPGDLDILLPWLNVIRRMRQKAMSAGGPAIVKMVVIVDEDGQPIEPWAEPRVVKLEPRVTAAEGITRLVEMLAE
jgi:hypothetical protein